MRKIKLMLILMTGIGVSAFPQKGTNNASDVKIFDYH